MRALAATALLATAAFNATAAQDRYPRAAAAYAVVVDGRLVWARALDTPRAPASLAKLLSALVLLDEHVDPAAIVTVNRIAASTIGTRAGLRTGEALTFGDALTAMLVSSANDACLALVYHVAPDVATFVARMNKRASELGMAASHFLQPCGLDVDGQQTTARDLLRLAGAAIAAPEIAARAQLEHASIGTVSGRRIELAASNLLLGREAGVLGLKSGFTNRAGKCLIAFAQRGEHRVWLVLLDAPDRWWLAAGLLDEAFKLAEAGMDLPAIAP